MRRFVDRSFPPRSLESDAADLLRAAAPAEDAAEAKQRVREQVMAAHSGRRVATLERRLVFIPAIAIGTLAFAAVAGATWGTRWWRGAHQTPRLTVAVPGVAPPPEIRPAVARPAAAIEMDEGPEIGPPPSAAESAARAPEPRPKRARSSDDVTEAGLLFEATRALRRDQDPVHAGVVLDGYFRRFPRGVLGEEALALAVQAATARGDARKINLAHRYLTRYPRGQFRATAERTLARGAP